MSRQLEVDEEAANEAETQARYYAEHAGPHVALRFVAEIESIYRRLLEGQLPGTSYPQVIFRVPIRRVLLDRYPFAVVFYEDADRICVIAIEALRRRPGYWRARLRDR